MRSFNWGPCRRAACVAILCASTAVAANPPNAAPVEAGPASLMQVYADALKHNAAFRARLAQVEVVDQTQRQVHGQLLPQVGLRGSYDYVQEQIEGTFFGRVDVDNDESFDRSLIGVQLTQALYRPELWISRDQAGLGQTQARFQLEADEDTLMLSTSEAYFAVLAAQDLAAFAKAERDALQGQLEQVRVRHDAGLATRADLSDAEARQALAAAGAVQADAGLQAAYAALQLVSGKPYRQLRALPDGMVLARPDPDRLQTWVERARSQNLGVLSAQVALRIAELEVDKARKRHWPRLDAAAGAYRLDSGGGLQGDRQEVETRIGVQLNMPLYAGGSIDAGVAEAEARRVAAQALLDAAVAGAERDARLAYLKSVNGLSLVPAQHTALLAAREAESAVAGGFDAGTRTSADVLLAIQSRFEAERAYSNARYAFMLDSLRLKAAAGDLANADLSRFDRLLRSTR